MEQKVLVLFVFHIYNERVQNFIDNCIFEDDNVDFIIISNGKNSIEVPAYVHVLYRENVGYDFGGWSDALLNTNLYKNYDAFIFVNSSIIGPFLPDGFEGHWTDIYINGLQDNVKLFGSTINTLWKPKNKAHVQSYIFSMKKETLEYLIQSKIFDTENYVKTFNDAIRKEVLMSRKIIANNWNIGSLMKQYQNVDFTFKSKPKSHYPEKFWLGNVMKQKYYKKVWSLNDLVIVKGNKKIRF